MSTIYSTCSRKSGAIAVGLLAASLALGAPPFLSQPLVARADSTLPVVTYVDPGFGSPRGNTAVTIGGQNLGPSARVYFGATEANVFLDTGTTIKATAPRGTGIVDVTVKTRAGTSETGPRDKFSYEPIITSLSPPYGSPLGRTTVTINGENLSQVTRVFFGTATAVIAPSDGKVSTNTSVKVVSPPGTGMVDVTVQGAGGTSATGPQDKFSYAPVVTSIRPPYGPPSGHIQVTINGGNLRQVTAVFFGTARAGIRDSFKTQSPDTALTVDLPPGTGVVDVTAVGRGGTSAIGPQDKFSYAPIVTSISPSVGPATGGTTVTITGENLRQVGWVRFGTVRVPVDVGVTATQDTTITAVAPPGTGIVDVTATGPGGTSATVPRDRFSYKPVVSSINPTFGPEAGGTTVTILGAGFSGATKVLFGDVPASSFSVNSDTSITATSPPSSGSEDVTVLSSGQTSEIAPADLFTYIPAPVVSGVSPAGGPPAGGTTVTITGNHFTGATGVSFGGIAAASFSVDSDTQITAVSPSGQGAVDVTVTNLGVTSSTNSSDVYTYGSAPQITAISPSTGPESGFTIVTITGAGFTNATSVHFGTVAVGKFHIDSDTQITTITSPGVGMVDVTVTGPNGTSATSPADQFTYLPAPTVSGVTPVSGPSSGGTTVTISGTHFAGTTAVSFGTIPATSFTVISDSEMTAVSPPGTGDVDIRVTNSYGTSPISSQTDLFLYL